MNRLQKKCFIASAGIHLLLVVVLLVGPSLLSSSAKPDDLPTLDFVPLKTVDDLISGGGNPKAKPPAAASVQPAAQPPAPVTPPVQPPAPEPEKAQEPAPVKQPEKQWEDDDTMPSTKQAPKPRKVEISKTLVTRKRDSSSTDKLAKEEAQARTEAKAIADARRRLAKQLGQAADNIGNEVSGGSEFKEFKGPGGGGVPYANWRAAIKTIYEKAWLLPDGIVNDDATAIASITIAKDGKVLDSRITHLSGDSVVDRSVQVALDRVRNAPPLPDTATETQRTVTINFSVRAKRALG